MTTAGIESKTMTALAIADLLNLLPIAGPPAQERQVAAFLRAKLLEMGIAADQIVHDNAQHQSEYGGQVGNLIVRLDGHRAGPRLLFSTHMDTVPNAVGCQPRLDTANQRIVNDAAGRALGGDNPMKPLRLPKVSRWSNGC